MTPHDDLDKVAEAMMGRLVEAAHGRRGAWRLPILATVTADGAPSARTVVLRAVDPVARVLEIFTDTRSAKHAEIAAEPRVALTFWDPETAQQLRMAGRVAMLADPREVDTRWQAIGPAGWALYRPDLTGDGPGERDNFSVLQVTWSVWDWLWIDADRHHRARFVWGEDGRREATWIAP